MNADACDLANTALGRDGHVDLVRPAPDLDAVQARSGLVAEHSAAAGIEQCRPSESRRPKVAGIDRIDPRMHPAPGPAPYPAGDRVVGEAGPENLRPGEGTVLEPDKVPQS